MARPYHYLRRSRHVGYPKRQVALVVFWDRTVRPDNPHYADDALTSWTALEWSGGPGEEREGKGGSGTDAASFWRWLDGVQRRKECTWLWQLGAAHGLTLLDFWGRISRGEFVLARRDGLDAAESEREDGSPERGLCVIEDPPTIIQCQPSHGVGTVRLVDVRNLGVSAWSDLGCTSPDCRALACWLQGWIRTIDDLNLGGLRHTAAAQSWHGWRYSYLECGVLCHGNADAERMEADSLHSGRAESFHLGVVAGGGIQLDASAHYPACALSGPLPCRLKSCGSGTYHGVRDSAKLGWCALCRVRVRCRVPLLPCRHKVGTIWPVGEWTVVLPWPEVERAAQLGFLVSVLSVALYEPGQPAGSYLRTLWDARQSAHALGAAGRAQCVKLLMNSLIGKFAARVRCWAEAPTALPPDSWSSWSVCEGKPRAPVRYRAIGWHAQRLVIGGYGPEATPALASWIYSVGRLRLLDWMDTAGMEEVYYVDSDSLITSAAGERRLREHDMVRPGEMGALRVQSVFSTLRIGGIRDYATDLRRVQSGVPKSGTWEDAGFSGWWRHSTVRESVYAGREPDTTARLVVVPVARPYRHGHVGPDGRIEPLDIGVYESD